MSCRYTDAKEAFVDEVKTDEYIELEGSRRAFLQLTHSLRKSTKMVLIYGKPGTGKTLLLHRLYEKYHEQMEIHLLDIPSGTRQEFYRKLFRIFTRKEMPSKTKVDFETFVAFARSIKGKRNIVVLLDEAQMYPKEMLEEIRVLSDTGSIKFVITLHKTEDEDLVAKKHFQSRIWETIELRNTTPLELNAYIHKRLLQHGHNELASLFKDRHIRLIHRWTEGNFRECNKLLYTLFEIYEYYDKHDPQKIDYNKISIKYLEMAAIKTGFVHV
ncbi:AAA family ATPase [Nitratifractor sp.]